MSTAAPPATRAGGRRALAAVRGAYLVSAALFVLFAADVVSRPLGWLVGFIPDDAFYYLQVARPLAATGRSTFDGLGPTNGYHPGWMALVTAAAAVFHDPARLLRAALALSLGLHLAASAILAAALRRLLGPFWGWTAGTCWLWNPLPLVLALQAMETSLLLFAVALALFVFVTRVLRPAPEPRAARRGAVLLGAALGLATWARTDMVVLAACAAAAVAWGTPAPGRATRPPTARRVVLGLLTLAIAVAALLPWWAYSWAAVGTPEQDSAAIKALWGHALHQRLAWPARASGALRFVQRAAELSFEGMLGRLGSLALAAEIVTAILIVAALVRSTPRAARLRRLLGWLGGASLVTLFAYGLLISDVQVWYLGLPGLALWLGAMAAMASLAGRFRVAAAAGLIGATAVLGYLTWVRPPALYPWQRDVLASLPVFEARMEPLARVGCFNAGIPAYFGTRTVVNLDGLVNHAVVAYWRQRRFQDYLRDARIDYVVDEEGAVRRALLFSSADLPLTAVGSVPLTGWMTGRRVLWKVDRPAGPAAP